MKEYNKVLKINKLANVVGCLKKVEAKKIELYLLLIHFIIIILSLINLLITPWKILNNSLFVLQIFILSFLVVSLVFLSYNQILRKIRKLTHGYYYIIAFFGTLFSIILILIDFLFIIISCSVIVHKIKQYNEVKYDHRSIIIIDVCSLLIIIIMFFLWYSDFLRIYARTDGSLKDFIDAKIRFYQSQNKKVVNVEGEYSNDNKNNDINNFEKIEKNIEDDIRSSNKMEFNNEKPINNNKIDKQDDISSVDTK
jgi:hypothetical protein